MEQSPAPTAVAGTERLSNIDIFRGLAIINVVTHHVLGMSLPASANHPILHSLLAIANVTNHFSVPCFLFMTALVLTRSAFQKPFDPTRFYLGRIKKILLPYVIWTILFAIFRILTTNASWGTLLDGSKWLHWLRFGKAYFHLYFLCILLQFYVVFPWLLHVFKRNPPFGLVLAAIIQLQILIYFLNLEYVHFRYVGTMAAWYIPTIGLGMYFGSRGQPFTEVWLKYKWLLGLIMIPAYALYIMPAYRAVLNQPVDPLIYQFSGWFFTACAAIILFGLSCTLAEKQTFLSRPLRALGKNSMQIYLLHPALLVVFKQIGLAQNPLVLILTIPIYILLAVLWCHLVAVALAGTRLSLILFGR